jgi:predicted DNA-binding transcriptional regulator AlpA
MDQQLEFENPGPIGERAGRPVGRDRLLFAQEVATMLRMTPAWVYAETRAGRLPHVPLGRYYRYRESAIIRWLAEQEQA